MFTKESFRLVSANVGDEFVINVASPPEPTADLQIAYVLDADFTFGIASDTAYLLSKDAVYESPAQILVVGIGSGDPSRLQAQRVRDFTPPDSFPEDWLTALKAEFGDACTSGGADRFLKFMADELDPIIRSKYENASPQAAILGDSLGGLFSLYCYLSGGSLFNKYWIGSPATAGRSRRFLDQFENEVGKHTDRLVYLSIGSLERDTLPAKYWAEAYDRLSLAFKNSSISSSAWSADEFIGETHNSVGSIALAKALSFLFRPT